MISQKQKFALRESYRFHAVIKAENATNMIEHCIIHTACAWQLVAHARLGDKFPGHFSLGGAKKRGADRAAGQCMRQAGYARASIRSSPHTWQVHNDGRKHNMRAATTPGILHTRRWLWMDAVITIEILARAEHFTPSQNIDWEGRLFIS